MPAGSGWSFSLSFLQRLNENISVSPENDVHFMQQKYLQHWSVTEAPTVSNNASKISNFVSLCWLSGVALTVNPHIHYIKQLKHRYCRCRPLVVTFVCYEFGRPHTKKKGTTQFVPNIPETEDVQCSHGDLPWWHMSFNQLAPFILGL